MNNDAAKVKSRATRHGTLHVVGDISSSGGEQSEQAAMHGRVWLGDVVAAVLVCCFVAFVLNSNRIKLIQKPSPQQERTNALVQQLSSLTQSDLIVFPDGRVCYVRAVHRKDLDIVGWIGDNARYENIDSFVLANDKITIVRHQDPAWPSQRDKYLNQ